MIRLFLVVVVAISSIICTAQKVVVQASDGEKYVFRMGDSPKLTIVDESLVIADDNSTISIPLAKVMKYTFDLTPEPSGVEICTPDKGVGAAFIYRDDKLIFGAADKTRIVNIYSMNGALLRHFAIQPGAGGYFDISALQKGVYVVDVDGLTLKVMK